MGFSPLGLVVSVLVLAPNLLLAVFPPRSPLPDPPVPLILRILERAGQALCLVVPAATTPGAVVWPWAVIVALAVAGYLALWMRYLMTGRRAEALFGRVWGIPVPLALLPVAAFAATAAWLSNPWILLSAGVLAAGHIPVSLAVARALR